MKSRVLIISFWGLCGLVSLFSSFIEKDYRHDEIISIPSEDTTISVKISYPEKLTKTDKVIVWSNHPTSTYFLRDSITEPREVWMSPILRNKMLDEGYINIEFIGRQDSVRYMGRNYLATDANTRAVDLENLLDYIHSVPFLKDKKILLVGHSEAGSIISMVASKNPMGVAGILQLSCRTVSGKEFLQYQREKSLFENMLIIARHGHQDVMDKTTNRVSSLDSYHTADLECKGTRQFFKENVEPLDNIIFKYQQFHLVYLYLDLYLRERWKRESKDAKEFSNNDFENYYKYFASYITPQQITLFTQRMEEYYPLIKCPVLAIHGTKDERVDCYPNIERMEQLLKQGGNENFQKMILEGYKHNLGKWDGGGYMVEDSVLQQILDWIEKL